MPKISVIIVNWNVGTSLVNCLQSIFSTNYPTLEIFVVDNASSDDSIQLIKKFASKINLIKNSKNIGFPKGVNIGLRQATGEFIVILNPDTQVPKNFFSQCLDFFSGHPDAGVMGPKFTNSDGTSQGSVFPEPSIANFIGEFWFRRGQLTEKYLPKSNQPIIVNCVSGGCLVLPKSTLTKIGLLTEKVFMYYEDLDYCRRVRNSGQNVYFNPQISILHEHGQSSKQSSQTLEYLRFASRWYNGPLKDFLLWFISWSGQKLKSVFP